MPCNKCLITRAKLVAASYHIFGKSRDDILQAVQRKTGLRAKIVEKENGHWTMYVRHPDNSKLLVPVLHGV